MAAHGLVVCCNMQEIQNQSQAIILALMINSKHAATICAHKSLEIERSQCYHMLCAHVWVKIWGCSGSDFRVEKFRDVEDLLRIILGLIWLHEIRFKNSLS